MGLLDDAIREHLELKRRHGADPGEIERQEHEAFGSPPAAPADEDGSADLERTAGTPADEAPMPYDEEEPAGDATGAVRAEDFAADAPTSIYVPPDVEPEAPAAEEPPPTDESTAPGYEEDPWVVEEEADPDLARPDDAPPAGEDPPTGAHEPRPGEEDVLEETPDFLQETPEHDRLWFEQKPPRDFDWDR